MDCTEWTTLSRWHTFSLDGILARLHRLLRLVELELLRLRVLHLLYDLGFSI